MKRQYTIRFFPGVCILLLLGIWLTMTACSGSKYYNRYPKAKECNVKDNKTKGWKK